MADLIYVRQVQLRPAANVSFRLVAQHHVDSSSFQLKHDVELGTTRFLCHHSKRFELCSNFFDL